MIRSALLLLLLASLSGCGGKEAAPKKTEPKKTEPKKTEPKKTEPKKTVGLVPVDKAGYKAEIARHRGKVVLVDFWGTWCAPCKKSFPATVKYDAMYGDKGLVVISLAVEFEYSDDTKKTAWDFLKKHQATFPNLIWKKTATDAFDEFEYEGMPHYRIYDHTGKQQAALTGSDVKDQLEAKFKELLVQRSKAAPAN